MDDRAAWERELDALEPEDAVAACVAFGDYRGLMERYGGAVTGIEPQSYSDRHRALTGHRLRFGCCASS